ncbi:6-phosphogluconate dehydrogenase C-terminal domain-like protein [Hysterangium stoloniferum]|nr:6-phosphogluconate dehydrogenase C-terminal domain-like protein [Hysterangium stoloniferum]
MEGVIEDSVGCYISLNLQPLPVRVTKQNSESFLSFLMLQVCLVGLGALGGLYSFVLGRSAKAAVTAVCRSNYDVVKDRGLDIRSSKFGNINAWKPSRVVKSTTEAADRKYDFIICAAKYLPDVITTPKLLGPLLSCSSTFLLIQNGIGINEDLQKATPNAAVLSTCAWVDASVVDGGRAVKHGGVDRLVLGIHWPKTEVDPKYKAFAQERLNLITGALKLGGSEATTTDYIDALRWEKNIWNIGYSVFSTLSRSDLSLVLSDKWFPSTTPTILGFMNEAARVGKGLNLGLPDTAIAGAERLSNSNWAETYPGRTKPANSYKPSMLLDLMHGRPMEVEGIVGGVVKKGREIGVDIPKLETAYATLKLLQESTLQSKAS